MEQEFENSPAIKGNRKLRCVQTETPIETVMVVVFRGPGWGSVAKNAKSQKMLAMGWSFPSLAKSVVSVAIGIGACFEKLKTAAPAPLVSYVCGCGMLFWLNFWPDPWGMW